MTDYERGYARALFDTEQELIKALVANQEVKNMPQPRMFFWFFRPTDIIVDSVDFVLRSLVESVRKLRP